MITVGLTGSIAMGKSTVADILMARGIPVFSADAFVHEIYRNGVGVTILAKDFPTAICGDQVNRQILATLVQASPPLLPKLEALIHPIVHEAQAQFRKNAAQRNQKLVFFDVPLLFEKNRQAEFDKIVVVSAHPDLQRKRALARPDMTPEKLEFILSKQWPDHKKRAAADFVLDNNGTRQELETAVSHLLAALQEINDA